jgi:hypothetical protein
MNAIFKFKNGISFPFNGNKELILMLKISTLIPQCEVKVDLGYFYIGLRKTSDVPDL